MKKIIATLNAPKAIGPYSQAVIAGGLCFVSGQLPIVPETGKIVEGEIQAKTCQVMQNIQAILQGAGLELENIVRCDIFVTDLSLFKEINEVYATFFDGIDPPARQTVQVARLPMQAPIEISCIATI